MLDSIQTARLHELVKQGDAYDSQYDTYHAFLCYQAALQLDSTSSIVRKVAQVQYKRGYYRDCIKALEMLHVDSINHQDMKLRYNCYANLDEGSKAVYWGKRMAEEYPYDSEIIVGLAHHYNNAEQPDSALYYTRRYNRNDSTNIFVNRQEAFALYQQGAYTEALTAYRKLLALADSTASLYYYTGLCYAQCDSLELAYKSLLQSAKMEDFGHPHVLSQLGIVTIGLGFVDEGIDYLQKAISLLLPDDQLMYTLTSTIANGYFKWRKYADCAAYLKKSMEYKDNSAYTLFRLGQVYGLMNDTSQESSYYQAFIERAEADEEAREGYEELIENARKRIKEIKEEKFFKGETDT
ncbi:MAG: hypothetical protein LUB83_05495 [Prevotellaceae bacterium]|nr:hypothetical protein [Prevotellaceae bacterium]